MQKIRNRYDIFISYRSVGSADLAQLLLTLLEDAGYKNRVSFDKSNFNHLFDIEILKRIDACKDFVILIGPHTFPDLQEGCEYKHIYLKQQGCEYEQIYQKLAHCRIEEFDEYQRKLKEDNKDIDFVRLELARALAKGKNIIPVVSITSNTFDWGNFRLPKDIEDVKRWQAVFYSDSKNFLFKSIIPDIVKQLKARKKSWLWPVSTILLLSFLFILLFRLYSYRQLSNCSTYKDLEDLNKEFLYPSVKDSIYNMLETYKLLHKDYVYTNDGLYGKTKHNVSPADSLLVIWNSDIKLSQLRILNDIFDKMVTIPKGVFHMGCDEPLDIEGPMHYVEITDSFYISKYEVTQNEWNIIMNKSNKVTDDNIPVANVSWTDCMDFIERLNNLVYLPNDWKFSLPTEAQWEYVAKANDSYKFSGSDNLADVMDIQAKEKMEVGQKKCNKWNIYDMTGNVKEWCLDSSFRTYSLEMIKDPVCLKQNSQKHIVRGGSNSQHMRDKDDTYLRIVSRDSYSTNKSSNDIGMRLVLVKSKH